MKKFVWVFFLMAVGVFAAGQNAAAQETAASIRGTVVDPSGALVSNAVLTATHTETGLVRTATSDLHGAYVLVELPVGHYRWKRRRKDSRSTCRKGISLDVNQQATVTFALRSEPRAGDSSDFGRADDREHVDQPGQTVGEREILDLPLNGRNFTQLGLLQTGVVPMTPGLSKREAACARAGLRRERTAAGVEQFPDRRSE